MFDDVDNSFYPSNTTAVKNSRGTLLTSGPHFPFGLSFLRLRFSEEKLISYAYAFEQATMVRTPLTEVFIDRQVRDKVDPYVLPNFQLTDVINPTSVDTSL